MNKYVALSVMLLVMAGAIFTVHAGVSSSHSSVLSASGDILPAPELSASSERALTDVVGSVVRVPRAGLSSQEEPSIANDRDRTEVRELESKVLPLIDEMCIHEGPIDNGYAFTGMNDIFAVSYTALLLPVLVESVQVYIISEGDPYWPWPDSIHQPFVISIYDESGGQPGAELFRDTVLADDVPPSWVMAYPNVVINSGDFWVAYEQLDSISRSDAIGIDSSYDNGPQNWYRIGGAWTQDPGLFGDLMICAYVSTLLDTSSVILSGNSVIPPTIDGVIDSAEWAEATVRDVSDVVGLFDGPDGLGSAELYVKNDEVNLYLALDAFADTNDTDFDDFSPYIDDNHDGLWPAVPDTNEGNYWFSNQATGDTTFYRYFQDGMGSGPSRLTGLPAGVSLVAGHQQFEGVIPFGALPEELQAMPGDTVGLFLLAFHANATHIYAWWPYTYLSFGDPAGYGDLVLAPGFGPAIILAEASDNVDSIPGIDPDDYVVLEFDEPTNKPAIDWSNVDNVFQLSGGHTWLDGFGEIGDAVWNGPGNQLLITLSTTAGQPTVAVGDIITPDGVTVTDALGNPCDSPIEITGSFGEPTGVEESRARVARPVVYALSRSSPNPFYEETEIKYAIPMKSDVSVRVYDLSGRLVRTLVQQEVKAGTHSARWDGRDEGGSVVPAGVYLYRLMAVDFTSTRKLVKLR